MTYKDIATRSMPRKNILVGDDFFTHKLHASDAQTIYDDLAEHFVKWTNKKANRCDYYVTKRSHIKLSLKGKKAVALMIKRMKRAFKTNYGILPDLFSQILERRIESSPAHEKFILGHCFLYKGYKHTVMDYLKMLFGRGLLARHYHNTGTGAILDKSYYCQLVAGVHLSVAIIVYKRGKLYYANVIDGNVSRQIDIRVAGKHLKEFLKDKKPPYTLIDKKELERFWKYLAAHNL